MIPYFGRHGCKQFIRGKPGRFGYKAWVAALRLGYCIQFDIYQGKVKEKRVPAAARGLGESVVMGFAEMLKNNFQPLNFSQYFDNFFTSANQIRDLTKFGYGGTGTVRVNRIGDCPLQDVKAF
jgi:DNA excision repair protein ERCC-6